MTYIPACEGWLYLAAVVDLYSPRLTGWSMDTTMAVEQRFPEEGLVAHSDCGSQHDSEYYQRLLAKRGITCRISRKGNCFDNSARESFFASLKKKLVHNERYATVAKARASVFESVEVFYDRQRRHSSIENFSPAEYENGKHP